jgi:hypothetical protein
MTGVTLESTRDEKHPIDGLSPPPRGSSWHPPSAGLPGSETLGRSFSLSVRVIFMLSWTLRPPRENTSSWWGMAFLECGSKPVPNSSMVAGACRFLLTPMRMCEKVRSPGEKSLERGSTPPGTSHPSQPIFLSGGRPQLHDPRAAAQDHRTIARSRGNNFSGGRSMESSPLGRRAEPDQPWMPAAVARSSRTRDS